MLFARLTDERASPVTGNGPVPRPRFARNLRFQISDFNFAI